MQNKYVSEILAEYESIAEEGQRLQKNHQREVYEKIPRIKEIDELISGIGFEIASSIFKGIDIQGYISEQKKRITDLKVEKTELLASKGFPLDYLDVKYKCSKCKDTGYVGNERCSCFRQKIIDRYYRQSNIRDVLKRENFDTFDISLYSEAGGSEGSSPRKNMERILMYCINFCKNFDSTRDSLLFYGNSGLGKTFLSNCIARELLDSGRIVIYQTASNLVDIIRTLRFEEGQAGEEKLQDLMNCDLLIIDDLGTESSSQYYQSELFNIINTKLLLGKKMLISTNYTIEELYTIYPERITSRIFGNFSAFKFFGDDIRLKKSKGKL